jgi:hypothetical protein
MPAPQNSIETPPWNSLQANNENANHHIKHRDRLPAGGKENEPDVTHDGPLEADRPAKCKKVRILDCYILLIVFDIL